MVHTAIVLPRYLHERLKNDAEALRRGVSTEIRERLMGTQVIHDFGPPRDPETGDLVDSINVLADNLADDLGKKWHQHPYALAAFKAGVATFLAQYQPEGDESARPDTQVAGEPDDPPDIVGRTHARLILNSKRGAEKK